MTVCELVPKAHHGGKTTGVTGPTEPKHNNERQSTKTHSKLFNAVTYYKQIIKGDLIKQAQNVHL